MQSVVFMQVCANVSQATVDGQLFANKISGRKRWQCTTSVLIII